MKGFIFKKRHNNCFPKVVYLFTMKNLLALFLLFTINLQSQDFKNVDRKVSKYPPFSKVEDLAAKIKTDFSSDPEKARAAFYWLATNINYNLKEYYNPTPRTYSFRYKNETEKQQKIAAAKNKIIEAAFKTKRGVCEEYAQSFKKICDLLNIEAAVIKGNVRNTADEIGVIQKTTNHAWNAVKLDGKWLVLDDTWAAGALQNGRWIRSFDNYFYNIPKEKIFKTHLPEKSIWVLRFGRITPQEFYNQPIYGQVFLALKTELVLPKNGILKADKNKKIELKLKNLPDSVNISYITGNQKYARKPILKKENKITILILENVKSRSTLVIYIDNKDSLHFKIN
ncbi:transglutaminase domain-containing protein [Polaribacter sp.]|uniref:transglutaminase domain-containing protein n=1 Tax=Polaribacter sp. TaxID=1920175 RepID=UPI003F6BC624